jgi:SAM-dependent methyltransferase
MLPSRNIENSIAKEVKPIAAVRSRPRSHCCHGRARYVNDLHRHSPFPALILRINLGASQTKLDGFVNIDVVAGCDLQLDLNTQPFPLESDSVECVFSFHTIEHLDNYLFALGEIWRVLKHGGRFLLSVPA